MYGANVRECVCILRNIRVHITFLSSIRQLLSRPFVDECLPLLFAQVLRSSKARILMNRNRLYISSMINSPYRLLSVQIVMRCLKNHIISQLKTQMDLLRTLLRFDRETRRRTKFAFQNKAVNYLILDYLATIVICWGSYALNRSREMQRRQSGPK